MSLVTEGKPDENRSWIKLGVMQDKSVSQWNDVKFFPFGNLVPIVEDVKGVAAMCGMNKIKFVKIDPITDELCPLHEISDRSASVSGGVPEVFLTLSWSIDTVSLQPIIAAAGARGVVKIFNVRSGIELGMLYGHGGEICALAFSPVYPHILASASVDHTVRIWNTDLALKSFQTRPGSESESGSLHPNWDNPPGQLITILAGVGGHHGPVCSITWQPVHPLLASGGMDNEVKIWYLSQLPGFPNDSTLVESRSSGTFSNPDKPAPITHLPIFSSKHVHSHWIDQIIWAGPTSPILVSKSPIVAQDSLHPFAEYAPSENSSPASEVRVWQANVLEDIFLDGKKAKVVVDHMWENEADAVVGGLDFEVLSSFRVPKLGLTEEQESVEWGLGMCLIRTQNPQNSDIDLAILVGNHPKGVVEIPLSSLERCQDPVKAHVHSSETTNHLVNLNSSPVEDQVQIGTTNFRALDATEIVVRNRHLSVSFLYLLRVGQDGFIELWKQSQKLIVNHNLN